MGLEELLHRHAEVVGSAVGTAESSANRRAGAAWRL
jgi:hypothetical protein